MDAAQRVQRVARSVLKPLETIECRDAILDPGGTEPDWPKADVYKNGPFDIPGNQAREWLGLPANPNGRPNADVLKPRFNGMDLTRRPAGKWIVDFGEDKEEADAALYEAPFAHVIEHVKPVRLGKRRERHRRYWWRHGETRPGMWRALDGLSRAIAPPHRCKAPSVRLARRAGLPDHQLIVIARDDDVTFGILHSRFHEAWSLRLGTWLGKGNVPRYTPTTTFETFRFPDGLSPDVPAADYAEDPRPIDIAEATRQLVELRARWLDPPEWVVWIDEPVPGYPQRPVASDEAAAKELKARTLTNLYNARPKWLADAHAVLDAAVATAYRWDAEISGDEAGAASLELGGTVMTAEIAILNRSAVALAADSAVTIQRPVGPSETETRVFKGANKVFALSNKSPVAVMIFGNASLMEVPWETLIKMYRAERGHMTFDTLSEYPHDFFSFLEEHDSLFPDDVQKSGAILEMQTYAFMVLNQALGKTKEKRKSSRKAINKLVGEEIESEHDFVKKCDFSHGFDKAKANQILSKFDGDIADIIDNVYRRYRLSISRKKKLQKILVGAITRIWFHDANAGIVFTGFGEKEHYPRLIAYRCQGVFENVVLRVQSEEYEIDSSNASEVVPFAQSEMVRTFILGIDPGFLDAVNELLTAAFQSLIGDVRAKAPDAHRHVLASAKTIRKQFDEGLEEYISENHAFPIYRIVDVLSKEELAELAENLITMESLKNRITQPVESVGGPIDVAVISKAEGVIWIKRKHYFDRE